jgi:hypothetical protein
MCQSDPRCTKEHTFGAFIGYLLALAGIVAFVLWFATLMTGHGGRF